LQLPQQTKINLNHKLTTFIPPFKINYQHKQTHITIQHLLPQTTPIPPHITQQNPYSKHYHTIQNILNFPKPKPLNHLPPQTFQYSNINYHILAL
ncbi:serine hydrolase, partial [Staphylococcus epidermidis]|uniref:serine hydrolase n=1 Tax=Staphylococcus epidermidis TaxID=1282 RepID=UPI00119E4FC6